MLDSNQNYMSICISKDYRKVKKKIRELEIKMVFIGFLFISTWMFHILLFWIPILICMLSYLLYKSLLPTTDIPTNSNFILFLCYPVEKGEVVLMTKRYLNSGINFLRRCPEFYFLYLSINFFLLALYILKHNLQPLVKCFNYFPLT